MSSNINVTTGEAPPSYQEAIRWGQHYPTSRNHEILQDSGSGVSGGHTRALNQVTGPSIRNNIPPARVASNSVQHPPSYASLNAPPRHARITRGAQLNTRSSNHDVIQDLASGGSQRNALNQVTGPSNRINILPARAVSNSGLLRPAYAPLNAPPTHAHIARDVQRDPLSSYDEVLQDLISGGGRTRALRHPSIRINIPPARVVSNSVQINRRITEQRSRGDDKCLAKFITCCKILPIMVVGAGFFFGGIFLVKVMLGR